MESPQDFILDPHFLDLCNLTFAHDVHNSYADDVLTNVSRPGFFRELQIHISRGPRSRKPFKHTPCQIHSSVPLFSSSVHSDTLGFVPS